MIENTDTPPMTSALCLGQLVPKCIANGINQTFSRIFVANFAAIDKWNSLQ